MFTLREFANGPDVNVSHFVSKKFLMTVGADNWEITTVYTASRAFQRKQAVRGKTQRSP